MDSLHHECRDFRLLHAYRMIDSGEIALLSLDVFDTLFWRKVPKPEDLFLILGSRLKEQGWLIPAITPPMFAQLRQKAEERARFNKKCFLQTSEVNLHEIYWELTGAFSKLSLEDMLERRGVGIYEKEVTEALALEVNLEKELIQIDLNVVQLLRYAKKQKLRLLLVSDTYFEESQILAFLFLFQLTHEIDQIYLSSEYGCSKQNGLFERLLEKENIAASKILHIGDHLKSDVKGARSIGMKTVHYERVEAPFAEILQREWPCDLNKRREFLDLKEGDFGLTSLRAKMAYHRSLKDLKKEDRFFWKYGARVLGPILFGFIHWIYDRCHERGENKVFCLMREGHFYAQLIKRFAPFYPNHVLEVKELWVSRLFMTHASITHGNKDELMAIMHVFLENFTIEMFCRHLGLQIDQMSKWKEYRHMMLEDPILRKSFALSLFNHREWRKRIIEVAQQKRERYVNYLSELIDPHSSKPITLVDVGWSGTAQKSLHQIFQLENIQCPLYGLYLGTTETTRTKFLEGIECEGYLFKGGYPDYGNGHKKGYFMGFILEQMATAAAGVGSFQEIGEEGEILTYPLLISEGQKKEAALVQEGVFAFFDSLFPYLKSGSIHWNAHSEALQNQLRTIFIRSMVNTTKSEAEKFGSWHFEHGYTSQMVQPIGKNDYYERFIQDMLPIHAFKESGLNWLSAYAAKNSKYLTLTSQAVWLNILPAHCFLSEDTLSLDLYIDTEGDFKQRAHKKCLLRSNANRNFYTLAKLFTRKKTMRRLQFKISSPNTLLRIKSLRLTCYDRQSSEPYLKILFEEGSNHNLECVHGLQLNGNTFYCDESLKLNHTFMTPEIYQVDIKLCCEMFKL